MQNTLGGSIFTAAVLLCASQAWRLPTATGQDSHTTARVAHRPTWQLAPAHRPRGFGGLDLIAMATHEDTMIRSSKAEWACVFPHGRE